ncbi:hypothetical protein B4Q13_18975 [Lacticaseibacillus rhamnosus]
MPHYPGVRGLDFDPAEASPLLAAAGSLRDPFVLRRVALGAGRRRHVALGRFLRRFPGRLLGSVLGRRLGRSFGAELARSAVNLGAPLARHNKEQAPLTDQFGRIIQVTRMA